MAIIFFLYFVSPYFIGTAARHRLASTAVPLNFDDNYLSLIFGKPTFYWDSRTAPTSVDGCPLIFWWKVCVPYFFITKYFIGKAVRHRLASSAVPLYFDNNYLFLIFRKSIFYWESRTAPTSIDGCPLIFWWKVCVPYLFLIKYFIGTAARHRLASTAVP